MSLRYIAKWNMTRSVLAISRATISISDRYSCVFAIYRFDINTPRNPSHWPLHALSCNESRSWSWDSLTTGNMIFFLSVRLHSDTDWHPTISALCVKDSIYIICCRYDIQTTTELVSFNSWQSDRSRFLLNNSVYRFDPLWSQFSFHFF